MVLLLNQNPISLYVRLLIVSSWLGHLGSQKGRKSSQANQSEIIRIVAITHTSKHHRGRPYTVKQSYILFVPIFCHATRNKKLQPHWKVEKSFLTHRGRAHRAQHKWNEKPLVQCHKQCLEKFRKLLLNSFHLSGRTSVFHQTLNLQPTTLQSSTTRTGGLKIANLCTRWCHQA